MHQNNVIASDCTVVVASTSPVDYCGLAVLTAGDVTVVTAKGNTRTWTGCPAGFVITMSITQVTACPANTMGYVA